MWLARDRDGSLRLYEDEPLKAETEGKWYSGFIYRSQPVSGHLFPEITWFDEEPTEVEIIKVDEHGND